MSIPKKKMTSPSMASSPPRKRMSSSSLFNWSTLPDLLLDSILSKLSVSGSLRDCLRFAATCRHWRSAARQSTASTRANFLIPIATASSSAVRVFHGGGAASPCRLFLPEISGHTVFGSRSGWLVAFLEPQIKLFNPFLRSTIPLPNPSFPDLQFRPINALLTSNPNPSVAGGGDCFVVVEYAPGKLAFARPRNDAVWRRINTGFHVRGFAYSKGKLYCLRLFIDSYTCVSYDLSSDGPLREAEIAPPPLMDHGGMKMHMFLTLLSTKSWFHLTYHLVEIGNELGLVIRFLKNDKHSFIEVLELKDGSWARVGSLGDSCLVVQDRKNMSEVDSREDPRLIPGCIYYPVRDSDEREVYYPSTSAQIWITSWRPGDRPPRAGEDVYSKIYPSVLLRPDRLSSHFK